MRWRGPVKPGDLITIKAKVVDKKSIEGKEYAVCDVVWKNQREEDVLIGTASAQI